MTETTPRSSSLAALCQADLALLDNSTTAAILPASGTGTRTGVSTAKQVLEGRILSPVVTLICSLTLPVQFWTVEGQPLMFYTLQTFESLKWLQEIVVPVSETMLDTAELWAKTWGLKKTRFIVGGSTRHRSVCFV